jgi:hypothetical protein
MGRAKTPVQPTGACATAWALQKAPLRSPKVGYLRFAGLLHTAACHITCDVIFAVKGPPAQAGSAHALLEHNIPWHLVKGHPWKLSDFHGADYHGGCRLCSASGV